MLTVAETTLVKTRQGIVRGLVERGVHVFRGIPYAAPPFGPNRLRPPQLAEPWTGERDATHDGPIPPQWTAADGPAAGFIPEGPLPGEDCLNLNIWTPDPAAVGLPVIVWITGGSFQFGAAGWYDGSRFARDGVVLVSINYRPGSEGFLHLRDAVPNRGLLDQVAALEWVRDTIRVFGGDPDNVTVCGESAGAMSIGMLLAMPAARGLFRRAILESGAAHHVLPDTIALRIGAALAATLGVEPTLAALARIPAERVLAAHEQLKAELLAQPDPCRWGAEVVASCMLDAARRGRRRDPGGAARADPRRFGLGRRRPRRDEPGRLAVVPGGIRRPPAGQRGGAREPGHRTRLPERRGIRGAGRDRRSRPTGQHLPTASPGELLAAIQTDWWCRIPAIRLADAHAQPDGRGRRRAGRGRTFMYEFAWPSPVAGGMFGACHALEIPFVFDTLDEASGQMLGNLLGDAPPQALARAMHRAWVSFAATGDPGWPPLRPRAARDDALRGRLSRRRRPARVGAPVLGRPPLTSPVPPSAGGRGPDGGRCSHRRGRPGRR